MNAFVSADSVTVSRLPGGRYRLTLEVSSEELGPTLDRLEGLHPKFEDMLGATSSPGAAVTSTPVPPAAAPSDLEGEVECDSRGRMKLLPFLVAIARSGGLAWSDRAGVAQEAMKRGWQATRPMDTTGKVLNRLVDESQVEWILRRGPPRSREYQILPLQRGAEAAANSEKERPA